MAFGDIFQDMENQDYTNYQNWYGNIQKWISGSKSDGSDSAANKINYWQGQGLTGSQLDQQMVQDMLAQTGGLDKLNWNYVQGLMQNASGIENQWDALNHAGISGANGTNGIHNDGTENLQTDFPKYLQAWLGGGVPGANTQGTSGGFGWGSLSPSEWKAIVYGGKSMGLGDNGTSGGATGILPGLLAFNNANMSQNVLQKAANGALHTLDPATTGVNGLLFGNLDANTLEDWLTQANNSMYAPTISSGLNRMLLPLFTEYQANNRTKDWNVLLKGLNQFGLPAQYNQNPSWDTPPVHYT